MNFESFKQEMKSEQKMNMNYDEMGGYNAMPEAGMGMPSCGQPIYECPRENVCHRYLCYEVPHIMPCNTRIINHHIYRHTYRPEYTCCEENVVQNIYDRPYC